MLSCNKPSTATRVNLMTLLPSTAMPYSALGVSLYHNLHVIARQPVTDGYQLAA